MFLSIIKADFLFLYVDSELNIWTTDKLEMLNVT